MTELNKPRTRSFYDSYGEAKSLQQRVILDNSEAYKTHNVRITEYDKDGSVKRKYEVKYSD